MKEVLQTQDLKNITFDITILKKGCWERCLSQIREQAQELTQEPGIQDLGDPNRK